MRVDKVKRLKQLEQEEVRLKQLLADRALDIGWKYELATGIMIEGRVHINEYQRSTATVAVSTGAFQALATNTSLSPIG
jgi:hypothetical protein